MKEFESQEKKEKKGREKFIKSNDYQFRINPVPLKSQGQQGLYYVKQDSVAY